MSHYTLDILNQPDLFPSFYVDQLKHWIPNDKLVFPGREHEWPSPTVVDGHEEFTIKHTLDSRKQGPGWTFLVRWAGQPPSEGRWLACSSLRDCAALDDWVRSGGDGPPELVLE